MSAGFAGGEPLEELRFALAEADAEVPAPALRGRVRTASLGTRPPGRPSVDVEAVPGAEAFSRAASALDAILGELSTAEWARPALRDLDVQGLVGHLIGVEAAFAASLRGEPGAGGGHHVASTQGSALAQAGRSPVETLQDWQTHVERSTSLTETFGDPAGSVTYYGITLPLDDLLVVRAFELWVHEEDIRRATGRLLGQPDAGRLARMTALAMALLPAGLVRADRIRPERRVRLVLTGTGGGTWDVAVGGDARAAGRPSQTRIVVDATEFCRVVGNRADLASSGALVTGDVELAADVFAGAAALALD
jgi:uncharacterized protein (TIGR03083 family)